MRTAKALGDQVMFHHLASKPQSQGSDPALLTLLRRLHCPRRNWSPLSTVQRRGGGLPGGVWCDTDNRRHELENKSNQQQQQSSTLPANTHRARHRQRSPVNGSQEHPGSALPAGLQETSKKAVSGPCSYTLSRRDREGLEPGCIIT